MLLHVKNYAPIPVGAFFFFCTFSCNSCKINAPFWRPLCEAGVLPSLSPIGSELSAIYFCVRRLPRPGRRVASLVFPLAACCRLSVSAFCFLLSAFCFLLSAFLHLHLWIKHET